MDYKRNHKIYRDNLYKKHKMTATNSPTFDIQKINVKTYNNILRKSIRLVKINHYESLFQKFKHDSKGT